MFIAMNRFRIAAGCEAEFIEVWKKRDSRLAGVPGFQRFNLLQGETADGATTFISHSTWESEAAFEAWTHSEAFRAAHMGAGERSQGLYLGGPRLELFEAVL
jgi:heme-degrading monooxygenase HmoA